MTRYYRFYNFTKFRTIVLKCYESQRFQLCEARPDLSGALFLFAKKKKAGTEGG